MTSGLIVSLMSKTIDYDAVAYRTGVILVEDPGIGILGERLDENIVTKWEDITTTFWADDIYRAGLAATNDLIKKKYPGILSQEKISRLVELNSITKMNSSMKRSYSISLFTREGHPCIHTDII